MTQAGPQRIRDGLSRGGRRVAVVHGTGSGSTLVTRQRAPRARWHYLPLNAMAWRVCRCRHVAVSPGDAALAGCSAVHSNGGTCAVRTRRSSCAGC